MMMLCMVHYLELKYGETHTKGTRPKSLMMEWHDIKHVYTCRKLIAN